MELAPFYGTGESALQLITGKSSVSGEEASRFWADIGVVPVAGGVLKKVGEPASEAIFKIFKEIGQAQEIEKQAVNFFGQQRKYWTQEAIQFNGNKVYQRNDLIDP